MCSLGFGQAELRFFLKGTLESALNKKRDSHRQKEREKKEREKLLLHARLDFGSLLYSSRGLPESLILFFALEFCTLKSGKICSFLNRQSVE